MAVDFEEKFEGGAEARRFLEREEDVALRLGVVPGVQKAGEPVVDLRGIGRIEREQCAIRGDGPGFFSRRLARLRRGTMWRGPQRIDRGVACRIIEHARPVPARGGDVDEAREGVRGIRREIGEAREDMISFWATPRKQCLNGKGSDCVPFVDWIKAWTEIKG